MSRSYLTLLSLCCLAVFPSAINANGNVFTMTNAKNGNQVLMYNRNDSNGRLTFVGAFDTGKKTSNISKIKDQKSTIKTITTTTTARIYRRGTILLFRRLRLCLGRFRLLVHLTQTLFLCSLCLCPFLLLLLRSKLCSPNFPFRFQLE